jgi:hypothetical protein
MARTDPREPPDRIIVDEERGETARLYEPRPSKANGPVKADVQIVPYVFRPERSIPRRPWVIRNLLLRLHLTTVLAAGGVGKSMLGLTVALFAAAGRDFGPFKIEKPVKVAFLSVEEDDEEIDRRMAAAKRYYGFVDADFGGRLHKITIGDPGLLAAADREGSIRPTPKLGHLHQQLKALAIDLLIIDPFVEVWEGEENSNMHMKAVATMLRGIARDIGAALLLMHHIRKGTVIPGDVDVGRGGSALGNLTRLVFTMMRMTKEMAEALGLTEGERRGKVRLDAGKGNYLPDVDRAYWFQFTSLTLDNAGDDGGGADAIGVLDHWTPPGLFAGVTYEQINAILDAVKRGVVDDDDGSPTGEFYTANAQSTKRWVGTLIASILQCEDDKAKRIAKVWMASGLLYEFDYKDGSSRDKKGLRVDEAKRPDATCES